MPATRTSDAAKPIYHLADKEAAIGEDPIVK